MNKSKRKGDDFERSIIHQAEEMALKAYRNRMSRANPGESWDISIAGHRLECKKRKSGFKQIRKWIIGNDGVVLGTDRETALVVIHLTDYLKMI